MEENRISGEPSFLGKFLSFFKDNLPDPDCQTFDPTQRINLDKVENQFASSAVDMLKLLIACTEQNVNIDGFYFGDYPGDSGWFPLFHYNETALMWAASTGHDDMVSSLIKSGADIHIKDKDGLTALLLAVKAGHESVISLLVDSGADINQLDNDGWTALIMAARFGDVNLVDLLIDSGADVNFRVIKRQAGQR